MALHETHKYDDIIDMPHHVSRRHPQMSRRQRAAQFMPFAALKGYYDLIRERERVAEPKRELTDEQKEKVRRSLKAMYVGPSATDEPFSRQLNAARDERYARFA